MSGFNGGGRGRGRGRGGGRGGRGGRISQGNYPKSKLMPCRSFASTGDCKFKNSCTFAHIVRSHAQIEMPMNKNAMNNQNYGGYHQQNYNNRASVSCVAIWESQGAIKLFSGSSDGYWRLYNTNGFVMEFENMMGDGNGSVECVEVTSNYLFCGFEGISTKLPGAKVGMIHAWNLNSPADPPIEFHMSSLAPYAHASVVTSLFITESGAVISGSRDGVIRVWQFGQTGFTLSKTLHGHAAKITGLTIVSNTFLWSSSTDHSMRIWDLSSGECKHLITQETTNSQGHKIGHSSVVSCVLTFENDLGKFVLSGSFDGSIKAWNGETGECLANESQNQGIVSMALNTDAKGNTLVLCGLDDGALMIRNVLQTQNTQAFTLLAVLNKHILNNNHDGSLLCIKTGPSNTFYTGGKDGKLIVWQLTGDFGL